MLLSGVDRYVFLFFNLMILNELCIFIGFNLGWVSTLPS
ncbi:hypothetical protein FM109_12010 [Vibrio casei]|nr:hypothetical protein FM109_12010 [Vibrio casei]